MTTADVLLVLVLLRFWWVIGHQHRCFPLTQGRPEIRRYPCLERPSHMSHMIWTYLINFDFSSSSEQGDSVRIIDKSTDDAWLKVELQSNRHIRYRINHLLLKACYFIETKPPRNPRKHLISSQLPTFNIVWACLISYKTNKGHLFLIKIQHEIG